MPAAATPEGWHTESRGVWEVETGEDGFSLNVCLKTNYLLSSNFLASQATILTCEIKFRTRGWLFREHQPFQAREQQCGQSCWGIQHFSAKAATPERSSNDSNKTLQIYEWWIIHSMWKVRLVGRMVEVWNWQLTESQNLNDQRRSALMVSLLSTSFSSFSHIVCRKFH